MQDKVCQRDWWKSRKTMSGMQESNFLIRMQERACHNLGQDVPFDRVFFFFCFFFVCFVLLCVCFFFFFLFVFVLYYLFILQLIFVFSRKLLVRIYIVFHFWSIHGSFDIMSGHFIWNLWNSQKDPKCKILFIIWHLYRFKLDFVVFKVDIISTENAMLSRTSLWRYMYAPKCYVTCGHTIFMTWRYPLNNSDFMWYIYIIYIYTKAGLGKKLWKKEKVSRLFEKVHRSFEKVSRLFKKVPRYYEMLRNGLNRAYCRVSARLKCQF